MSTITRDQVMQTLEGVRDPELGGNVVELGMITHVDIDESTVDIGLALTIAECPLRSQIEGDTRRRVEAMPGVESVNIRTTAMTKRQRAELMSVARRHARENAEPTQVGSSTRVIAVASGKGGVGKSSVSVNLAAGLAAQGHRVAVIDCDIYGFSVPRMLGATGQPVGFNGMIMPLEAHGVRVISIGFFLPPGKPVAWRGPMLHRAIQQFLTDVYWGDLDYVLADLPPG